MSLSVFDAYRPFWERVPWLGLSDVRDSDGGDGTTLAVVAGELECTRDRKLDRHSPRWRVDEEHREIDGAGETTFTGLEVDDHATDVEPDGQVPGCVR